MRSGSERERFEKERNDVFRLDHPGVKLQSFPSQARNQTRGIPHIPRAAF